MSKLVAATVFALALAAAPALAQEPPRVATRNFVSAAAESDQFETTEASVVAAQSHDGRVLGFARRMMQDHAGTTAALKAAAARSGLARPAPGLDGDQARLLATLQSLTGPAFDRMYAKEQVLAHTQALVAERHYADTGADPNLRQAARDAIPVIQHHLEMAQQLRGELGGA